MITDYKKEFLFVEEAPERVKLFYGFLQKCNLEDKLIHAWSAEDAMGVLRFEDTSNLELIIIQFNHGSTAHVALINAIRANAVLKSVPIVVLTDPGGNEAIFEMENIVINALVTNPIDFRKFKIILALAGYVSDDLFG